MVQDLAERHSPTGDLFQCGPEASAQKRFALSEDQLAFFDENGYVAGMQLLSEAQVDALREELKGLMDPAHPAHGLFYEFHLNESGDPQNALFHALGAWRIASGFHDLLWNPAFTVPARQLLGGPVRFWHDQLFCKPPREGGVVAWHQDFSYWTRTEPMAHLSCWIGLDDSTRENGCLSYIPGSHRWDLLPITGLAGDMQAIEAVLTSEQRERFARPVYVELRRGQAAFHHPLIVHGSEANRSARPRRATVINAFRDGVRSASDEPLLAGVPPIAKGQKMEGRFFPLLCD